jgi:FkbM family methyltransferase
MFISPSCRHLGETYEPEIWKRFMQTLRPGDVVADVGAHHGLYSVAAAKRIAPGRIFAFEPDPENYRTLCTHVALNRLENAVTTEPLAVGAEDGKAAFSLSNEQSHFAVDGDAAGCEVKTVRLDTYFPDAKVDILKVDVEGFEEWVLRGAERLLSHPENAPRAILVELHPYAWNSARTSSESLLKCLEHYDIRFWPASLSVPIERYGHLFAYRRDDAISPS